MSESRAGSLNRSMAHFIAAFGNLQNAPMMCCRFISDSRP
jgi:glutaminase